MIVEFMFIISSGSWSGKPTNYIFIGKLFERADKNWHQCRNMCI